MANEKTLAEKLAEQIGWSNAALEKAAAAMDAKEAQDRQIVSLVPQVVDALVENQRIDATEKEAAAAVLQDPVQALQLLINVAAHRNGAEQSRLGTSGLPEKRAAAVNSLNSPYVGARTSGTKESDRVFYEKLGLALPE